MLIRVFLAALSISTLIGVIGLDRAAAAAAVNVRTGTKGPPPPVRLVQLQPTVPPMLEPELPLPANATVRRDTRQRTIAPFRAHTQRPKSVLSVFVGAGQTAQLQVPLGSYIVRYAAGENWYG
jgi:hypothetical protein